MSRKTARELALRLLYAADVNDDVNTVLAKELAAEAEKDGSGPKPAVPVCDARMLLRETLDEISAHNFQTLAKEDELYRELPNEQEQAYIGELLCGVSEKRAELDGYITKYAVGWQLSRIARVTRSILRLSMYEVLYMDDIPDASSINEAVDFAKTYDGTDAGSFVNGILGTFVRAVKPGKSSK